MNFSLSRAVRSTQVKKKPGLEGILPDLKRHQSGFNLTAQIGLHRLLVLEIAYALGRNRLASGPAYSGAEPISVA